MMSDERPQFFEGPEKKVELAVVDEHPSLRELGDAFWREVVHVAGAEVVSSRRGEWIDAYLLSESSLFVYDNFVTMITCGRTTLVSGVDRMLERIDPGAISVLVYERKNEHFPHEQPSSFFDDARALASRIEGRAIRFGVEHGHAVRMFHTTCPHAPESDDRTLEILMHGIDPNVARMFDGESGPGPIHPRLGLERALEGYEIDELRFDPRGYSLNGIRGPAYVTLHVTPERLGSYVSFETNAAEYGAAPNRLISEVVGTFSPESFDVVAFEPERSFAVEVDGYVTRQRVREPLSGYEVSFTHLYRPDDGVRSAFVLPLV